MFKHLLVPLDNSELSHGLVTQAVNFAHSMGAKITFFTAHEDYAASEEGVLQRTLSPQDYQEDLYGSSNAILARAKSAAKSQCIDCNTVIQTGDKPYKLILQVAEQYGCDLIYMASHGVGGLKGFFMGSQTQKVLNCSALPVLVARVEKNISESAGDIAIQIIQREHRAIAAVNDGLSKLVSSLQVDEDSLDLELLKEILFYIKTYPEKLHHPKEELFLFKRLNSRTDVASVLISQLEKEHSDGASLLEEIESEVAAISQDLTIDTKQLIRKIQMFVKMQWGHLNVEEMMIIPMAREHLKASDWLEIEQAFRQNDDIKVGSEHDAAYEKLFNRLMNHLAQRQLKE